VSYLYITHDLAVARYMCDRIAVMYLGKIVEIGPTEEILANPRHPYTKALLSAVPVPDPSYQAHPGRDQGRHLQGDQPAPECRFIERCPFAAEVCRTNPHPPLQGPITSRPARRHQADHRDAGIRGGRAPDRRVAAHRGRSV
jgi:oligopeptide/dipeptide ABC transporter ATP-binding protein